VIVRILGEGQLTVPETALDELNGLDDAVQAACDANDEAAFGTALTSLLTRVRDLGVAVPDDEIVPSELVLPPADSSLAEVSELLGEEGLIPG
jgi:hypothetical protein